MNLPACCHTKSMAQFSIQQSASSMQAKGVPHHTAVATSEVCTLVVSADRHPDLLQSIKAPPNMLSHLQPGASAG